MTNFGHDLLTDLKWLDWQVVANTYGNNHSTLIGILVRWWVSSSPRKRSVLEGAPTIGKKEKGSKGNSFQCDAILCEDNIPIGLLEVEGSRPKDTAEKIRKYFETSIEDLSYLKFAILFCYPTKVTGKKSHRVFSNPIDDKTIDLLKTISNDHKEKPIIALSLLKS